MASLFNIRSYLAPWGLHSDELRLSLEEICCYRQTTSLCDKSGSGHHSRPWGRGTKFTVPNAATVNDFTKNSSIAYFDFFHKASYQLEYFEIQTR